MAQFVQTRASSKKRDFAWLAGYASLWIGCVLLLRGRSPQSLGEQIALFAIFGIAFPIVVIVLTLGYPELLVRVRDPRRETPALLGWCAVLFVYFIFVRQFVAHGLPGEHSAQPVSLILKLLMFVALPIAGMMMLFHYKIRELLPATWSVTAILPAFWLSVVMLGFQCVFGNGLSQIRATHLSLPLLLFYAAIAFIWLAIEAGLVEEFFFRTLLQERLVRYFESEIAGIVIAALLFGLMHSPGFYLRTAAAGEALGAHPSVVVAVAYSIVNTSAAGIFFGTLWARTRNLAVVIIVHASLDLLPGLHDVVRHF